MTIKENQYFDQLDKINIFHNFEDIINKTKLKFIRLLSLSEATSEENLIIQLKKKNKISQAETLETLINTREMIIFCNWIDRTN